jgi:hypothetical protein
VFHLPEILQEQEALQVDQLVIKEILIQVDQEELIQVVEVEVEEQVFLLVTLV